jgi:predicted DNA binding protein
MPCVSQTVDESYHELSKDYDQLTRVACNLNRVIENCIQQDLGAVTLSRLMKRAGISKSEIVETVNWVRAHKAADEARFRAESAERIKEKKRKAALSKLTDEERELLGISRTPLKRKVKP